MNKSSLFVTYSIEFCNDEIINEVNLSNKEYADRLARIKDIYGLITLEYQGKKIQIKDEIVPWIQNLCFDALSSILAEKKIIINYFSKQGQMIIKSGETSVLIQDEFNSTISFPFKVLMQELYACGERFIIQLSHIKREDLAFMGAIKHLEFHRHLAECSIDALQYVI